jgi:hypothetical protein
VLFAALTLTASTALVPVTNPVAATPAATGQDATTLDDRINHTPKDETLKLKIGSAFDVVCERNQTDFRKISGNVYELAYEIALRNHKSTPITVEVNEPIGGTWRMLSASHDWTKTAAWAAGFVVPVKPDGTSTLRYRVQVTY